MGTGPGPGTRLSGEVRDSPAVKGASPYPPQCPPARLSLLPSCQPSRNPGKAKAAVSCNRPTQGLCSIPSSVECSIDHGVYSEEISFTELNTV